MMHINANIKDVLKEFSVKLWSVYDKREAENIIKIAFESLKDAGDMDQVRENMERIVRRLLNYEPIQYITREADFYGLKLKVGPSVLIPRPETEELVHLVISAYKNYDQPLRILDIGTGSGCIAIKLKKELQSSELYAIDISEDALKIAEDNANKYGLDINFKQMDILNRDKWATLPDFDIIISNPPYIPVSEKAYMHKNVVDYEPHEALFVKDDDPLLFYRSVLQLAMARLNLNGKIFFEIHEKKNRLFKEMGEKLKYISIRFVNDLNGKDRFVIIDKKLQKNV